LMFQSSCVWIIAQTNRCFGGRDLRLKRRFNDNLPFALCGASMSFESNRYENARLVSRTTQRRTELQPSGSGDISRKKSTGSEDRSRCELIKSSESTRTRSRVRSCRHASHRCRSTTAR
jgi:hypothetical protein